MRATMTIAGSGGCYRIAEPTEIQARALEYAKTVPTPWAATSHQFRARKPVTTGFLALFGT
jgi:hypothetical protein